MAQGLLERTTGDRVLEPPPRRRHRVEPRGRATAVAAALVLLAALLLPDPPAPVVPRIPVEALALVALALVLPGRRARGVPAAAAGAVLGVLVVLRVADLGFHQVLARPFDPLLDAPSLRAGAEFLDDSIGRPAAVAVIAALVLAATAVPVLVALSAVRVGRLVAEHRRPASRVLAALVTASVAAAVLGVPVASASAAGEAAARAGRLRADLRDRSLFAAATAHDRYRYTPADRLLTGLRGKDVVVAFVESYGRDAVEDPRLDRGVDAALVAGTDGLRAAGFGARSGWLGSPTSGGGSWLAHSTFLSGVRVDNQQRYTDLVGGDRLTLNGAFGRAGWRTVGIMPGVTRDWPEGAFYRFDTVRAAKDLGYRGPSFSWATMPDQYTLETFQRLDRRPGHAPVMAEIPLVSSHAPWTPLPELVPWDEVGDGSVFAPMAAGGESPTTVWKSPAKVRAGYARSIAYSVTTLVQWVQRYGDDDLVLVLLGDHQPVPLVTGKGASRDVPVTVVAHDPAVLDRISGWGWTDGMRPAHDAPVWPMETFRDRFLAAYGPR